MAEARKYASAVAKLWLENDKVVTLLKDFTPQEFLFSVDVRQQKRVGLVYWLDTWLFLTLERQIESKVELEENDLVSISLFRDLKSYNEGSKIRAAFLPYEQMRFKAFKFFIDLYFLLNNDSEVFDVSEPFLLNLIIYKNFRSLVKIHPLRLRD